MELLKHEFVKKSLLNDINSGKYRQGERIPSIRKLSSALKVSVGSVNRATLELVDDGLLTTFKDRRGIFVSGGKIEEPALETGMAYVFEGLEYHDELKDVVLMSTIWKDAVVNEANTRNMPLAQLSHAPVRDGQEDTLLLEKLSRYKFIVFNGYAYIHWAKYLESKGCFVLFIAHPLYSFSYKMNGVNRIFYDREGAMKALVGNLLEAERRNFGFICSRQAFGNSKHEILCDALKEKDIAFDPAMIEIVDGSTAVAGYKAVMNMADRVGADKMPDAILVDAESRALGVVEALKDSAFKFSERIAVAALDGVFFNSPQNSNLVIAGPDYKKFAEQILDLAESVFAGKSFHGLISAPFQLVTGGTKETE